MKKINYEQFRHLMSAMLFISDALEKEQEINDLYTDFKTQQEFDDPVEWTREIFEHCDADTHVMYIRSSFTAQTYFELAG